MRAHPSSCAVTRSLVVYHFCWFHIWEDDEGEKEMWASVICPATYPSTVISSVQQLGACKCSPWCASGCKNSFIIFRNTWLTGCGAGRKWTWIDLCHLLIFLWLTACLYLSSWLLNILCHTGSTKVNTLKVCLQLFERCMIYYSAFTYLSYWLQPASVNVITKSLCLQDNDKFPGKKERRLGKRQPRHPRCHTQELWNCLCIKSNSACLVGSRLAPADLMR